MGNRVKTLIFKGESTRLSSLAQLSSIEGKFSRYGYVLSAWNTKSDGSGISYEKDGSITTTENTILYAIWQKNNYTVDFYVDSVLTSHLSVPYEESASDPLIPYEYSHDKYFIGWNTEEWKNVVKDLSVYSVLSNRYWVSYMYDSDKQSIGKTDGYDYIETSTVDYAKDIGSISARQFYVTRSFNPTYILNITSNTSVYVIDIKKTFSDIKALTSFYTDGNAHSLSIISVALNPEEVSKEAYTIDYSESESGPWSKESPSQVLSGAYTTYIKLSAYDFEPAISAVNWRISNIPMSADIYKVYGNTIAKAGSISKYSGDTILVSEVEAIIGNAPEGYKFKEWNPAKTSEAGWYISENMNLCALYEQISGEITFIENYPIYE